MTVVASSVEIQGHGAATAKPRPSLPAIVPAPAERHLPFALTDLQLAYWLGRNGGIELGAVGNHGYGELECANLMVANLRQAWRRLLARHDMLRVVIDADGRQRILPTVPAYEIAVIDLRRLPAGHAAAAVLATRERMSHQVRPASHWPLFEVLLSQLADQRWRLHISLDLLVCDLRSLHVLFTELVLLYQQPRAELPPLELSFRDVVLAEAEVRASRPYLRAEAYWRERLAALPPAPQLPLAREPGSLKRPRFARRSHRLDRGAWSRLRAAAARHSVTPNIVLAAAYADVLATFGSSSRFTLNLPTWNRWPLHPQVNDIMGCFTSFLLLEVDGGGGETFAERARRLQDQLWRDLDHQLACGVWLLRELARGQSPAARMPVVFTSTLGLSQGTTYASLEALGDMVFEVSQTPQVWLDYLLYEQEGELWLDWDAVEDLFPPGLLDAMFASHSALLDRLAEGDAAWTSAGRHLAPADQLGERAAMHAAALAPVPATTLTELILAQAREDPLRPAVIAGGRAISFGELCRRSRRLALLLRQLGCGPERPVALALAKGWEQVAAALAVVEAGAPFMPLDPAWPAERLAHLIARGEVEIVLTAGPPAAGPRWPQGVRRIAVDDVMEPPADAGGAGAAAAGLAALAPLLPLPQPHGLAYVLFTSGSSGTPKGVMIEHRSLVNRVLDVNHRFGVRSGDRVLALTALHHDLAMYDLFGALAAGAAMVLPEPNRLRDPAHWAELIARQGVTIWNSVPALLEMLVGTLEAAPPGGRPLAGLRLALLAGDWIPLTLKDRVAALADGVAVIGLGGPTETTVWDICHPIAAVDPGWKSIPYGRPMANASYHVFDRALADRPTWVPGELYIGGVGLARGYWRDEERTRQAFVAHPRTGERLFRSGDLGRYLPDGSIEFLGRDDLQVKLRGQRVELGEIEATLLQHPAVESAVAAVHGDERRLVAFVVPCAGFAAGKDGHGAASIDFKLSQPGLRRQQPGERRIALSGPEQGPAAVARYAERRSYRRFLGGRLTLADLGRWLSCLRRLEIAASPLPKYRYPSGGGLYPVQAYIEVKPDCVADLAAGVYYYHPARHHLALLTAGAASSAGTHLPPNRRLHGEASFTIFLIGQLHAIAPIYGEASRDFCMLEAGYMSQLLMSEGPRCGIGLCPIGQLEFAGVRGHFRLDDGHLLLHSLVGGPITPEQRLPAALVKELAEESSPPRLESELRAHLSDRLPAHMVPAAIELLDRLPLTANGKVDRAALSARRAAPAATAGTGRPPRSEIEKTIAAAWQQALGVERVDVETSFFDLGGNSLHVVQVYRLLARQLGAGVSTELLFRHPTIHSLAVALAERAGGLLASDSSAASDERAGLRQSARRRRRAGLE